MKHKAQEALDDISNMLYTTDYVEHIRCQSYPIMEDEQGIIKQLIDCQVSKEFIDMTIDMWESEIMNCTGYTSDEEQCIAQGLELLRKQKEMWEEE